MPYSITREDAAKDATAVRLILGTLEGLGVNTSAAVRLAELADSIEEQVKPVVAEPTEQWSVIRATPSWADAEPREFTRIKAGFWVDHDGNECGPWETFSDVEVLRIGVGEAKNCGGCGEQDCSTCFPETSKTYQQGFGDCALYLRKRLIQLRSSAITAERQDAYDKAIEAVEALA